MPIFSLSEPDQPAPTPCPGHIRPDLTAQKGKVALSTVALSRADTSRAPETVSQVPPDAEGTLRVILASLDDIKAEETVTIDLRGKSSIADDMIVTSGRSHRHVGAIAERVVADLEAAGIRRVRVEGLPNCDWVLIDAGDVIVHVFRPEVRTFYNLEKMWAPGRPTVQRAS